MRYGSVCSGIEAATMAWHALGWQPAFFSEIEAFPRAVLEHRYPAVPLHGDFTTIEENQYGKIDLLVGGTPCQSFSVAGLRGGLDDERGNLALEFCRLAQRERPRWIVWENVPGVLSSNGGRDFGSILGALAELGYGLAYRVLDAQYFGVAQRRRRVFVVGYLGDWRRAAAVLFERHSLSGHPAPRREARKDAASGPASGADSGGGSGRERLAVDWPAAVSNTLDTDFATKWGQNNQHVNAGCPVFVPDVVAFSSGDSGQDAASNLSPTIRKGENGGGNMPAIAIQERAICENPNAGPDGIGVRTDDAAYTLEARTVPQAVAFSPIADCLTAAYATKWNGNASASNGSLFAAQAVAFQQNTRDEVRYIGGDGQIAGALAAQAGAHQTNYIAQPVAHGFYANQGSHGAGSGTELSPTLKASASTNFAAVAYPINSDADRANSSALTPSPDAEGRVRLRDPGLGVGEDGDPMYTLQATKPHAVAYDHPGRFNNIHGGSGEHRDVMPTLEATNPKQIVAAFRETAYTTKLHNTASNNAGKLFEERTVGLDANSPAPALLTSSAVRRLTPRECERLQGFPDGFTAIPWRKKDAADCPDGPRYKALGNSMAVPVMRWIGERIQMIEDLTDVL